MLRVAKYFENCVIFCEVELILFWHAIHMLTSDLQQEGNRRLL